MLVSKAIIQRYDPAVTQAPFTFITLGEFEFTDKFKDQPNLTGREYSDLFSNKMHELGYQFRFYSGGSDGYNYCIIVD